MENKISTDVIIIGSGLAGCAAAYRAASAGKKVLVLEKMPYYGGNSALAGGGYAASDSNLKYREKFGLEPDSWQLHAEDTFKAGGGIGDMALIETMAKGAPEGLNWLLSCGVTFTNALNQIGGHSVHRAYMADITGREIMDRVHAACEKAGAAFQNNTRVTDFLLQDGRIAGVKAEASGQESCFAAKDGVILASGGFSRDTALRQKYCPALNEKYGCSNHKGATGELLTLAESFGADTVGMEYIQLYPCGDPKSGGIDTLGFHAYTGPGYGMVYVNQRGERFVNELLGRDAVSDAQVQTCEKPTFAIFNQEIADILGLTADETERFTRAGRLYAADTLEGLAEAIHVPAEALRTAVDRHNAFVAGEQADDFGKVRGTTLKALDKGPFYAVPQWPTVHFTMGGLRIDTSARVLDRQGQPIPGLYAAGECCGGIHGKNRLGGNALAECVVFGFIAGECR